MNHDDFYIGWQPETSGDRAKWIKSVIFVLIFLIVVIAVGLVLGQKSFATSQFELGKHTNLVGILRTDPIPMLVIRHGEDANGAVIEQLVLLVSAGKHGAVKFIKGQEDILGEPLESKTVSVTGSLIYHDGKALMEIKKLTLAEASMETEYLSASEIIGHGTMVGEVTDPKCLFGVMKPGYGKPHRSCAARCIAGGIPPVLKVQSKSGTTDYYILVQHDGRPANDFIFPFVGDQIVACGEVRQVGDWKFFYLKNDSAPLRVPEGLRFITSHCAT